LNRLGTKPNGSADTNERDTALLDEPVTMADGAIKEFRQLARI